MVSFLACTPECVDGVVRFVVDEFVVFNGEGIRCVHAYKNYLRSGDKKELWRIVFHNRSCLLRELMLVTIRPLRVPSRR